jgi:hypothetical protein
LKRNLDHLQTSFDFPDLPALSRFHNQFKC